MSNELIIRVGPRQGSCLVDISDAMSKFGSNMCVIKPVPSQHPDKFNIIEIHGTSIICIYRTDQPGSGWGQDLQLSISSPANLIEYYNNLGVYGFEGYSQQVPGQVFRLNQLIADSNIKTAMEIGFNAGHSAEILLSGNDEVHLTSFDLGIYGYVKLGKNFIDSKYSNRHILHLGDSKETLPKFINENPDTKFDFIFIDGGHDYETAKSDIENCKKLAHKDTIVIVDDTIKRPDWVQDFNEGPNKAWNEFVENGEIKELGSEDYTRGRGNSWGKYNLT